MPSGAESWRVIPESSDARSFWEVAPTPSSVSCRKRSSGPSTGAISGCRFPCLRARRRARDIGSAWWRDWPAASRRWAWRVHWTTSAARLPPPVRVVATPIATAMTGDARRTLGLLAGAAALAALIAFTNLAGLLIVRAIDRRRELAVRSALGARRFEVGSQLLLEAQAVVTMGIAGGVLLASWMAPVVARLVLEQSGAVANRELTMSWRVIGVVSIAASACAWICGSLP